MRNWPIDYTRDVKYITPWLILFPHILPDISLTYACPMCNTWYRVLILVPHVHVVNFSSVLVICPISQGCESWVLAHWTPGSTNKSFSMTQCSHVLVSFRDYSDYFGSSFVTACENCRWEIMTLLTSASLPREHHEHWPTHCYSWFGSGHIHWHSHTSWWQCLLQC